MTFTPNSESLQEMNTCHSPGGSPAGGQFCGTDDGPTTLLHRGDSADVNPSLNHADPSALFGAGIYLTDSKRIAGDYTVKGQSGVIFRYGGRAGMVKKADVLDAYFRRQSRLTNPDGTPSFYSLRDDDGTRPARIALVQRQWEETLSKTHEMRVNADGSAVIQRKAAKGRVASYNVPQSWLSKTIDAEEEISPKVRDAIYNTLRAHGDTRTANDVYNFASTEDEDGFRPSFRTVFTSISGGPLRDNEEASVALRKGLKDLGYKGIKYSGGITIGGAGNHNAYVIWDEQGLKKRRAK